jgi:hypothetical protein
LDAGDPAKPGHRQIRAFAKRVDERALERSIAGQGRFTAWPSDPTAQPGVDQLLDRRQGVVRRSVRPTASHPARQPGAIGFDSDENEMIGASRRGLEQGQRTIESQIEIDLVGETGTPLRSADQ